MTGEPTGTALALAERATKDEAAEQDEAAIDHSADAGAQPQEQAAADKARAISGDDTPASEKSASALDGEELSIDAVLDAALTSVHRGAAERTTATSDPTDSSAPGEGLCCAASPLEKIQPAGKAAQDVGKSKKTPKLQSALPDIDPHLLHGVGGIEKVIVEPLRGWHEDLNGNIVEGALFLSEHRVGFVPCTERSGNNAGTVLSLPFASIQSTYLKSRGVDDKRGKVGMIKVYAKDSRVVRLFLRQPTYLDGLERPANAHQLLETQLATIFASIQNFVHDACGAPDNTFRVASTGPSMAQDGSLGFADSAYVADSERMGAFALGSGWRLSDANSTLEICPTYPHDLVVPVGVADDLLAEVSKFRSKGRVPILSWIHPRSRARNPEAESGERRTARAAIVRCSQPSVGLCCHKSEADWIYLRCVSDANAIDRAMLIADARPAMNASANRCRGGG
jgi:hypothetical protein